MGRRLRPKVIVPLILAGLLAVLAVIAAVGVIGGVGGVMTTSQQLPLPGAAVGGSSQTAEDAGGVSGETQSDAGGGTADKLAAVPPAEPRAPHALIRTGDLALLIERSTLTVTMSRIATMTAGMDGYIMSSSIGGGAVTYDTPVASGTGQTQAPEAGVTPTEGWLTLRVPQARFDAAVKQFSALGAVERVSTSSEDVTDQYVDLRARLRHNRAVERRLLRFLAASDTIREMLLVQDRLDEVQLSIEQLEAQLKSLRESTTYATLTISLHEKDVPEAGEIDPSDTFAGVLQASLRLLARGARLVALGFTAALPWLAVFAAIGAVVWYALRWWRRRRVPPPAA